MKSKQSGGGKRGTRRRGGPRSRGGEKVGEREVQRTVEGGKGEGKLIKTRRLDMQELILEESRRMHA